MFEDFLTLHTLEDGHPGPLRGPGLATSARYARALVAGLNLEYFLKAQWTFALAELTHGSPDPWLASVDLEVVDGKNESTFAGHELPDMFHAHRSICSREPPRTGAYPELAWRGIWPENSRADYFAQVRPCLWSSES